MSGALQVVILPSNRGLTKRGHGWTQLGSGLWEGGRSPMGRKRRTERRVRGVEYEQYLRSDLWKKLRREMAKELTYRCWVCRGRDELHLHHKTYKRIGREEARDLMWLCKGCHGGIHALAKVYRRGSRDWRMNMFQVSQLYRALYRVNEPLPAERQRKPKETSPLPGEQKEYLDSIIQKWDVA